ncbi:hypothetical protein GCK72_018385 [Caenorhabditis remanei]|uniref:Uncharacterized protein n=1 Tax=Caenorhabditis remanei TaxID=31234 RepID=A0A6A5GAL3_CAERE|nr:hypothetical protein GCK72_018385 [Caenorhabditis remanei]KAF1751831.1 hypothetical protein GCK72_018385 [Caenorhabditis remanei]
MQPTIKSSGTFILEVFTVLGALAISLMAEKRFLCAPRMLFVFQQVEIRLLCLFEVFATTFINLIYLSMLHLSAVESGLTFLAITFFLLAAFFLFAMISICQWIIEDQLILLASKLFSYQLVQVVLFLFCTLCVIRLTMRQDIEKKKPLRTYLPHYILTYCSVVLFLIAPKTAFLYAVVTNALQNDELMSTILRGLLFITPIYNLFLVLLINCQDPERRGELAKSIKRAFRGIKTGPIPRINVQEPTSSSALASRSHIALNLMRNPMNSFNKLQRQSAAVEGIPPQNSLRVPRDQRYYATEEEPVETDQVPTPQEILTSRNSEERGFMTVALLRRASQISQRFQGIRGDSARTDSACSRTPSPSPRSSQKIESNPSDKDNEISCSPRRPSSRRSQPLDVSQLLGFFISSSTSSVAMTIPVRNKRAVERIQDVLHQNEQNSLDFP